MDTEEEIEAKAEPAPDGRSAHRIVWDLAWPAIALNSLQVVNSLLDSKFLGMLGPVELSASGAAITVLFFLISLAIALGTGATALVSRFYGADKHQDLIKASRQAVSLSFVAGILLAVIGFAAIPILAPAFVEPGGPTYFAMLQYLYPIMLGMPALYVFNSVAASMRAVGNTKTPMYVSGFQIVIHIILNFLLIFPTRVVPVVFDVFGYRLIDASFVVPGAGMGIAGSGWSFTISAWVAAVIYLMVSGRTVLGSVWHLQMISLEWARRILRIAMPASLMSIIRVTSLGAFMAALKHTADGELAHGALRVGFSMEGLAFMPAFGYMIAASALVGQSLGMRDPDRAERLAWSATNQAVIMMAFMSVIFLVFAPQLAGFFVEDPQQRQMAILYLRIVAITEVFFGYAMVLTGAHQGAGDTVRPTWVALIASWFLRVPAVWVFAVYLGGNSTAAWIVMSVSQLVQGLMMIYIFKLGMWKEKEV